MKSRMIAVRYDVHAWLEISDRKLVHMGGQDQKKKESVRRRRRGGFYIGGCHFFPPPAASAAFFSRAKKKSKSEPGLQNETILLPELVPTYLFSASPA